MVKKIHFIGIGGIGMSALAGLCIARGSIVTGSDLRPNDLTRRLHKKGARIFKGHLAGNLPVDADMVVHSACIKDNNHEMRRARELGLTIVTRSRMLGKLMEEFPFSIAVTGTHGKTTTSAIIAHIAEDCGGDPTVLIGGETASFNSNMKLGKSDMIIAELDESDGYFQNISSTCAVITNVEKEHMEHYGCLERLVSAYRDFIARISPRGVLVFNGEDPMLKGLVATASVKKHSFGINGNFDVTGKNCAHEKCIKFELTAHGRDYGRISSPLIGRYNLMNLLGATAVCLEVGFGFDEIVKAIGSFKGVKRRFTSCGKIGTIEVIEDYAHHPTELRSVIAAAKNYSSGRVVTIFQPHRYSRTRDLLHEFSGCFYDSDLLVLTDIYSADEDRSESIAIEDVYRAIDKSRFEKFELIGKKAIPEFVSDVVREDDIVLVLGAGDINMISKDIVKMIEKKRAHVKQRNS